MSKRANWHTPPHILEAARDVLGVIDLDPASSAQANETVQALDYFTPADDGLAQSWQCGRLWLNPPYSATGKWLGKLKHEIDAGRVLECIALVPSLKCDGWAPTALDVAERICLPSPPPGRRSGRLSFIDPDTGKPERGNTDGSTILYHGARVERFVERFSAIGRVLTEVKP